MSQQAPVFIIVGKPHAGKSTVRNTISVLTELKGGSCSDVIYHFLAKARNTTVEELKKLPKEELRADLIKLGDELCGIGPLKVLESVEHADDIYRGPSALVRMLFLSRYRVIDGVRRRLELQNAREHIEWLGIRVIVFHVERPGYESPKDNTEDLKDMADIHLVNDGTAQDLCTKVEQEMIKLFPPSLENAVIVDGKGEPVKAEAAK